MGFFGAYLYANAAWSEIDFDAPQTVEQSEPWLSLVIHDSDIATVRYAPSGHGIGEAFIGITPRVYFEDESASAPTDPSREAHGLLEWAHAASPDSPIDVATLMAFLASDDEREDTVDDELDDADIFVEIKSAQFLKALGLDLPGDLPTQ